MKLVLFETHAFCNRMSAYSLEINKTFWVFIKIANRFFVFAMSKVFVAHRVR